MLPTPKIKPLPQILETAVLGESRWGESVYGSPVDTARFEEILRIISDGSFPKPGQRDSLSDGQRRQLRDAMSLLAHARENRDIFITNDLKAVGSEGSEKRQQLSTLLNTKIMSAEEFVKFCKETQP